MNFWEHLDELRGSLLRILGAWIALSVVAFALKQPLFDLVLAPSQPDFFIYLLPGFRNMPLSPIELINTGLAGQFMVHMRTAMAAGLLLAAPYALYELFRFVSPGLYSRERSYASGLVTAGYVMFMLGVAVSYCVVFPLTFRFLGDYHVAGQIQNLISLESYMSTLLTMSLSLGLVFEMPVLAWLFGKLGLISAGFMRQYRRHAVVIILTAAAIITPTTDVFTLAAVSAPMWLLYEGSILLVAMTSVSGKSLAEPRA